MISHEDISAMTDEALHIARQAAVLDDASVTRDPDAMTETPERQEVDDRGMPQTLWRHADGTVTDHHPERYWEYQDYVREDIGRAHIDRLSKLCGYAICQWESWVRDQLEGTSYFADAMAEIVEARAAIISSERTAALAQMESNDG